MKRLLLILGLVVCAFTSLRAQFVIPTNNWQPPIGIPFPPFGIVDKCAPRPNPWTTEHPGYYYVDQINGSAGPTYGTPASPRNSLPTALSGSNVVELHNVYTTSHARPNQIVMSGTSPTNFVCIRGTDVGNRPTVENAITITGSYYIIENVFINDSLSGGKDTVILSVGDHGVIRHSEMQGDGNVTGGFGVFDDQALGGIVDHMVIWDCNIHDTGNWHAGFDQDNHGVAVGDHVTNFWLLDSSGYHTSGDFIQINAGQPAQASTNHLYVGRNISHDNKQTGGWTKEANDVIFSQNLWYNFRPSTGSSIGACGGGQYAPNNVWFLMNECYNSEFGLNIADDAGLGSGTNIYFIGNVIHDIIPQFTTGNDGFQPCGLAIWGLTNHYLALNTIYNVHSGICDPSSVGAIASFNNIIDTVGGGYALGAHIVIDSSTVASASVSSGNVFAPNYIQQVNSLQSTTNPIVITGTNDKVEASSLMLAPGGRVFNLQSTSPAIQTSQGTNIDQLFAVFKAAYGIDISKNFDGTVRNIAPYDAGAYRFP